MIRGVLFDLGETLLNFGAVDVRAAFVEGARLAWEHLSDQGRSLPPIGRYVRTQKWAIRLSYLRTHLGSRELDVLALLKRSHRSYGLNLTDAEALALAERYYQPLGRAATLEPQARQVLEELRRRGQRTAIVSNTFVPGELLDAHLRKEGIIDLFEARLYSCQVGWRKPDRRIYQAALEAVGLPASACVFVGDTFGPDIVGPARMGMFTVYKTPAGDTGRRVRGDLPRPAPTACVRAIAELPDLLDHIEATHAGK